MVDFFTNSDLVKLLYHKKLLFIGDHTVRNVYKDIICLYRTNKLLEIDHIGRHLESSFMGDQVSCRSGMCKLRSYSERRQFTNDVMSLEFLFVTQCLSADLINYLRAIRVGLMCPPDVIYMNSFIWDVTRWGPEPYNRYIDNINQLIQLLNDCLPKSTLFIWATTCPVSDHATAVPFVQQISSIHNRLYSDILEANIYTANMFKFYGYDVIDVYNHLFMHVDRRMSDGVTFDPCAIRYNSLLLLTHIALSWDITLPGRLDVIDLHEEIAKSKLKFSMEKTTNYWLLNENDTNLLMNEINEKRPQIRVKATWEVLEEFGNDTMEQLDNTGILQDCLLNEPEYGGNDENGNSTTVEPMRKNEEKKEVDDELEEGELIDDDDDDEKEQESKKKLKIKEKLKMTDWQRWKALKNDLLTLEISNKNHTKLNIKLNNYNNDVTHEDHVQDFLKQIKHKLKSSSKRQKQINRKGKIKNKNHNNINNNNNCKLLFGYEKNERFELLQSKLSDNKNKSNNDNNKNKNNIEWVAEQWRKVLQSEPSECKEVLSYRQRKCRWVPFKNNNSHHHHLHHQKYKPHQHHHYSTSACPRSSYCNHKSKYKKFNYNKLSCGSV